MKATEYKNEVGSLKLSDEFKAELKKKMLEVYEERSSEKNEEKITVSSFSKKYGKYAALAACLVLVAATAGVLTLKGLPMAKSAAPNPDAAMNEATQDVTAEPHATPEMPDGPLGEGAEGAEGADDMLAEGFDDGIPLPEPAQGEGAEDGYQDDLPEVDEVENVDEDIAEDDADEETEGTALQDGSPYSRYASEGYDGDYNGDDYVLSQRSVTNAGSATVYDTSAALLANSSPVFVAPVAPAGDVPAEAPNDNVEAPASADNSDAPSEGSEEAEKEGDYGEPETLMIAESADGAVENTLASFEYYDIRDGVIAKLDKIALVRFTIEDVYTGYAEVSVNTASGVTMDVATQTLYSININREYLSNESENADRLLLNYGTANYQLYGRPVMQGEYIALVYENADGVLEPIPQLVYSVHNVNGLDIAYHVYCEDGYEVDPGSTNMGILPEETEAITNTANNPERYTQKAAVRELTYYLRRNIMRMEPTLLNVSGEEPEDEPEEVPVPTETEPEPSQPAETQPAQTEAPPEPEEPVTAEAEKTVYSNLRAQFPTGLLVFELPEPGSDGLPNVNGISVGDSLEDAIKAFYLTKYGFTPDAVITLVAPEEEGGRSVTVRFADGIVSEIVSD